MKEWILASLLLLAVFPMDAASVKTGSLQGIVRVEGEIKKVKTKKAKIKYGGYSSTYGVRGGSTKKKKKKVSSREGHMVVYLEGVEWKRGKRKKTKRLGQKNKQFTSDVLAIVGGDRVDITNDEENIYHHIFSKKKPWDFDLKKKGPGKKNEVRFKLKKEKGIGVVPVFCNFHSNMNANILVMENPFFNTISENGGKFSIRRVPPGTYTLTAWHAGLEPVKVQVKIRAGKKTKANLLMKGKEN